MCVNLQGLLQYSDSTGDTWLIQCDSTLCSLKTAKHVENKENCDVGNSDDDENYE